MLDIHTGGLPAESCKFGHSEGATMYRSMLCCGYSKMYEATAHQWDDRAHLGVTQGPYHVLLSSHPATQQE